MFGKILTGRGLSTRASGAGLDLTRESTALTSAGSWDRDYVIGKKAFLSQGRLTLKRTRLFFFFQIFIYLFIYPWLVLGLRFCARAPSNCGKRRPLFIAVRWPLTIAASLVAEHRLQTRRLSNCGSRGPAAPRHKGSSLTRARTRVPCTGRQTLNHCATREAREGKALAYKHLGSDG